MHAGSACLHICIGCTDLVCKSVHRLSTAITGAKAVYLAQQVGRLSVPVLLTKTPHGTGESCQCTVVRNMRQPMLCRFVMQSAQVQPLPECCSPAGCPCHAAHDSAVTVSDGKLWSSSLSIAQLTTPLSNCKRNLNPALKHQRLSAQVQQGVPQATRSVSTHACMKQHEQAHQ